MTTSKKEKLLFNLGPGLGALYQQGLAQSSLSGNKKVKVAGNIPDGLRAFKNGSLSVEQKLELTKLIEAGEVFSIQLPLAVFKNQYPNLNFVRFRDNELGALARSSTGQPFLRDHNAYETKDRVGTIDSGSLKSDGQNKVIVQEVTLTDKRAMLDYVGGRLDRFSIGWNYKGLTCTVCGEDWRDWSKCSHYPGREYDGVTCEVICEKPMMRETSYVNSPAVGGTGILSALSAVLHKKRIKKGDDVSKTEEAEVEDVTSTEDEELAQAQEELEALAEALGVPAIADRVLEHDEKLSAYEERIAQLEESLAERDELIAGLQESIDRLSGEPVGTFSLRGMSDLRKPAYAQRLINQVKTASPQEASKASASDDRGKGKTVPGTNSGPGDKAKERGRRFLNSKRAN